MTPFEQELVGVQPHLLRFATHLTRCPVRAEDLAQATMLRALDKRHQFTPGTSLKGWVNMIMKNMFIENLRKQRREVEDADGAFSRHLSVPPTQEQREELRDLLKDMQFLSEAQQETVYLIALGHTIEETAEITGRLEGTIKSQTSRGRRTLNEVADLRQI